MFSKTGFVILSRVDHMIAERIPVEQQADARHLVSLSFQGGSNNWIFWLVAGLLIVIFTIFLVMRDEEPLRWKVHVFFFAVATALCFASGHSFARCNAARAEFDRLVQTDPERWRPLAAAVQEIAQEAGQFPEGNRVKIIH